MIYKQKPTEVIENELHLTARGERAKKVITGFAAASAALIAFNVLSNNADSNASDEALHGEVNKRIIELVINNDSKFRQAPSVYDSGMGKTVLGETQFTGAELIDAAAQGTSLKDSMIDFGKGTNPVYTETYIDDNGTWYLVPDEAILPMLSSDENGMKLKKTINKSSAGVWVNQATARPVTKEDTATGG